MISLYWWWLEVRQTVSVGYISKDFSIHFTLLYLKVGRMGSALTSTETLEVVGQSEWKIFENSLPHGLYTAKAITLNNEIYLMGNF